MKIAIRGILAAIVAVVLLGFAATQPAKAIVATTIQVEIVVFPGPWNGSYDYSTWAGWPNQDYYYKTYDANITFGMIQQDMAAQLGGPVTVYSYVCEDASTTTVDMFPPPASAKVTDYPLSCLNSYAVVVFKSPHHHSEIPRLTLYGYVSDSNQSCVLWSLQGALPVNVDKTCGSKVKLVCTVQLFGRELKYDCKGGYDWLGQQIVNDPKWLAWADRFASMNGHK